MARRLSKPAWRRTFETWADGVVAQCEVPGMAVALAAEGRPLGLRAFGRRDREAGLEITSDTVFGIGAVSKSFTAVAVLQLQERGLLAVDHPVSRHLPELRVPNARGSAAMRIEHLLTHTSGLPPLATLMPAMLTSLRADRGVAADMGLPEEILDGAEAIDTPAEMIAYLNGLPIRPLGRPGEVFNYSNDGYALLGEIVTRLSGEAYAHYLRRYVLQPAGMARTTVNAGRLDGDPDVTVLYARRKRPGEAARGRSCARPSGGSRRSWQRPASCARPRRTFCATWRSSAPAARSRNDGSCRPRASRR